MFQHNSEFGGGTLMSLRSLALVDPLGAVGGTGGDGLLSKSLFSLFV
jgi:hypothetical protein